MPAFLASWWSLIPWGVWVLVLAMIVIVWKFPTKFFYVVMATAPMIGILVSYAYDLKVFRVGELWPNSVSLNVGEIFAAVLIVVWLAKMLVDKLRGKKVERPWLPLGVTFGCLVIAHVLSLFSPASPSAGLVLKYSLRPVLWVYLTSIVLPVNFIRTRKTLVVTLTVLTVVGLFFSLDALRSFYDADLGWQRAHPMPFFGWYPLGDNHNVLAEWLVFTAPVALALSVLVRESRRRIALQVIAAFMLFIACATLARTAYVAIAAEAVFLVLTVGRERLKRQIKYPLVAGLIGLACLSAVAIYGLRAETRSSTDARFMLTDIAVSLFVSSPWLGVGAGSFVSHVGQTYAYRLDFGGPMDAHGMLQKVAAETGILGLLALTAVALAIIYYGRRTAFKLKDPREPKQYHCHSRESGNPSEPRIDSRFRGNDKDEARLVFMLLSAGVIGAGVYQMFNTTYWTPKLWLSVGIFLAAGKIYALCQES